MRDPETKYSNSSTPVAITKFSLAVNRRFKREGEPDADFFNCTAFGKTGEFVDKYFKKGQMIALNGHLQVRSWDNDEGKKQWATEVIAEEVYFTGSKADNNNDVNNTSSRGQAPTDGNFYPVSEEDIKDEDLPF